MAKKKDMPLSEVEPGIPDAFWHEPCSRMILGQGNRHEASSRPREIFVAATQLGINRAARFMVGRRFRGGTDEAL